MTPNRTSTGVILTAVTIESADYFDLTDDELRAVARFAAQAAQQVLPIFEQVHPDDPRPRAGVEAAWIFVNGADRSKLQRVTATDAHRAARAAATEAARHAAAAAGDAASAAYLHPLAKATQVGHILRAAAHAARAAELVASDPLIGDQRIQEALARATPTLVNVLSRYPAAPPGRTRVAQLMTQLDSSLRRE